jgi:hypothetical protein
MPSHARDVEPLRGALSPTARRVLDALSKHVSLAWPILKGQCEIAGVDPMRLSDESVPMLVAPLVEAVSRFAGAAKVGLLRDELLGIEAEPRPLGHQSATLAFRPNRPISPVATRVVELLTRYSPLAWPLLESQCKAVGISPETLTADELKILVGSLRGAIDRFGAEPKGEQAAADLLELTRGE